MEWSGAFGATFSLVGVLIGAVATLLSQYLVARAHTRNDAFQREELRRTERKEMIVAFLAAAQKVEMLIDAIRRGEEIDQDAKTERMNDVWLAKKVTELVCSSEFAQAAHNYTATLESYLLDNKIDRWSPQKRSRRWIMLESARQELGNTSVSIARRLPGRQKYFEEENLTHGGLEA